MLHWDHNVRNSASKLPMYNFQKFENLKAIVRDLHSTVVAFSGGVDSTFLLKVCCDELPDRVLAVTAVSETYTPTELDRAKELAQKLGVEHLIIRTEELQDETFASNPPDRCYYCKRELFSKLRSICRERGYRHIVHGATASDRHDYRPGSRAASELGARAPLAEADFTKDEIRELSRKFGLATWNLPSSACLASRIPYGTRITRELLATIAHCENILHEMGFATVRVRFHDEMARIEVSPADFAKLLAEENRTRIAEEFRKAGFAYVTLDIEGYRQGSMNIPLER